MNNYKKYLKYKYKYYALKKQIGGSKVKITSLTVYDPSIKQEYAAYLAHNRYKFKTKCVEALSGVCSKSKLHDNEISQCVTDKLTEYGNNKDVTFTDEPDSCIELRLTSTPLDDIPIPIPAYRGYIKRNYNYKPYLYEQIFPNLEVDPEQFKKSLPPPPESSSKISKDNISKDHKSNDEIFNDHIRTILSKILSDKPIGIIINTKGELLNKPIKDPDNPSYGNRIIYAKIEIKQTAVFTRNEYIYKILNTNQNFNNALKVFLMGHLKLE
jgi:hypothetical protein